MIHVMHLIFALTFSLSIFLYRVILICSKCKTACKQFRAYCGQNKFSLTSLFRSYQHIRDYVTAATHCRKVVFHENPRGLSFFSFFCNSIIYRCMTLVNVCVSEMKGCFCCDYKFCRGKKSVAAELHYR